MHAGWATAATKIRLTREEGKALSSSIPSSSSSSSLVTGKLIEAALPKLG